MILGLGMDITETARLEKALRRFGRRFAEKILAPRELAEMPQFYAPNANMPTKAMPTASVADAIFVKNLLPYISGRFAAKEAAVKALGTGFSQGIGPRDIEITRGPNGQPQMRFINAAATIAKALGVTRIHLSISHERSVAAAVVVLEA